MYIYSVELELHWTDESVTQQKYKIAARNSSNAVSKAWKLARTLTGSSGESVWKYDVEYLSRLDRLDG